MVEKEIPRNSRDEEETKSLISSLPSDIDAHGSKIFKYQECWYAENRLEAILNFHRSSHQAQETDIIVASFPKSGTTWLKALTFALVQRLKHPLDHDDYHPLLSHNPHDLVVYLEEIYLKSSKPDLTKFSSSLSSPRLFSTHMTLHTLQVPFKEYSPCKIVYVYRNVKDVLVSLWHFKKKSQNGVENCTLEALFESFCSGVGFYGPFWGHVLSYWRGSLEDPKHVLFMRYEELIAEPRAQIKRLAKFLDSPFTQEEEQGGMVDKILELCSLRNLSGLEINKTGKRWTGVDFKSFFREGKVGDSKNYLTLEMENKIDMIMEEKFKGSGFKF